MTSAQGSAGAVDPAGPGDCLRLNPCRSGGPSKDGYPAEAHQPSWVRRRPDWVSRAEGVQGFTGIPDPRGQPWFRHDFRQKKIKCSRALAIGARQPPAFAVAGGDCHCASHPKGAILASKPPGTWRMSAHTVRRSDRAWSGCWAHRPPAVGSLPPDPAHSWRGA